MSSITVLLALCGYAAFLFILGVTVQRNNRIAALFQNPVVYSLSLCVYCTAWTFYGSIGLAANSGILFLAIYIGPTLALLLLPRFHRHLFRLKERYHITSVADLVSIRYGKSASLAAIVTVVAFAGIVPYIALQLRAVVDSFNVLTAGDYGHVNVNLDLILVCILVVFTILVGSQRLDPTRRHPGVIAAISVDAVVKLVIFITAGTCIVCVIGDGFVNVLRNFNDSQAAVDLQNKMQASDHYLQWVTYLMLSMSAIVLLPRQFHVTIVENSRQRHFRTALWLFPLYLLAINLLVLPVAMVGLLEGYPSSMADMFLLILPGDANMLWLEFLVFIGGFSAAISMIIISSLAMSIMITNHLVLPVVNRIRGFDLLKRQLLKIRWAVVALFIYSGYLFAGLVNKSYMLVDIGIVSFAAIFQFVPAVAGGVLWEGGTKKGARMGIAGGFLVWVYMLLLPTMAESGIISMSLVTNGPFGIQLLRPVAFLGLDVLEKLPHAVFWSLLVNAGLFVICSIFSSQGDYEKRTVVDFSGRGVDVYSVANYTNAPACLLVDINMKRPLLVQLLSDYYKTYEAEEYVGEVLNSYDRNIRRLISVEEYAMICTEIESVLAGLVGSATAHSVMSKADLYTDEEMEELSRYYGEVIANLRLRPEDLKRRIDYYRERDSLLTKYADDLTEKINELRHEIEQRQKMENRLNMSLQEKEVLIKEIHHRVKNNMQIITSLLGLQMRNMDDSADRELFRESQERIYAMALVHEKLYQSDNLANIDFADYIKGLINEYRKSYGKVAHKIAFNVVVDNVKLCIDEAIPCGLIINELITNALKHAFPDKDEGHIDILFQNTDDGSYLLRISDDGRGFPGNVFMDDSISMGFQLVRALVNQLNASIDVESGNGATFTIIIPA
ncbi:MAG: histidine kinase dimerization/phosphoacceptor domain -containing protein [Spirochaetota bacterium]